MTPTRALALATVAAVTSSIAAFAGAAFAGPLEVGAGVGLTQTAQDASNGAGSQEIDSLFARLGLFGPLAAQLEVGRVDITGASVRTATAAAVLQFGSRVRPFVLAGGGVDEQSSSDGWPSQTFTRIEVGAGLEVRATGGLTVGIDLRDGTRTDQSAPVVVPEPIADPARTGGGIAGAGIVHLSPGFAPTSLAPGGYRVLRLTVGIAF